MSEDDDLQDSSSNSPDPTLSDWFLNSHQSSLYLAEKTCEMVCYLWFSSNTSSSRRHHFVPQSNPQTASLQFSVSPHFVQFMQKVLETTQVSQSVIVLSLHYIYRLKERNRLTNSLPGSEFRVAIAALMMANKFVDDNTYTNKTWSDVSGISLEEINKMEREILLGIDFSLYVNKLTYESWLNLLKGLVFAKEKDGNVWKKSSYSRGRGARSARAPVPSNSWPASRSAAAYATPTRPHRARSTSPSSQSFRYPFTFTSTTQTAPRPTNDQRLKPGAKRSAQDAFSPTSTSFPPIKAPRRNPPALSLSIPVSVPVHSSPAVNNGVKSGSPLDNLPFSKLSLASNSPAVMTNPTQNAEPDDRMWVSSSGQHVPPKTLSAAWPLQERERAWAAPQNLYYYSLACSPTSIRNQQAPETERKAISVAKKAKLRYHPAPQTAPSPPSMANKPDQSLYARTQSTYSPRQQTLPIHQHHRSGGAPMVVHSASTSPDSREAWLDFRQIQHHQNPSHGVHAQQYRCLPTVPYHHLHQHQFSSPDRLSVPSLSSTASSVSVSTPSSADSDDVRMSLPPFNEFVSGANKVFPASYHQTADHSPLPTDHENRYRIEAQPAPFANAGPPGVVTQCAYSHDYGYGGHLQRSWVQQAYPVYGTPYSYGQSGLAWLRSRGM